jgi:hypothetical protein
MIQANEAYAAAGIDPANTVALAKLAERTARQLQRRAPANTPSGRRQQAATTRQRHFDTIRAGQQARADDLSFEHDMGRLTDAAYADQLEQLASTIKHNKALKRQLLLEAHNIRKAAADSSGLDMNFANIKIPTVYEIRRAMKGGMGPSQSQVQLRQTNQLNVTVANGADVDEVFKAIDGYTGAGLQAAGRAQGVV